MECVFGCAEASGRVVRTVAVPLQRPVLMHDFAMTSRHAVFVEGSLVLDPSVRDLPCRDDLKSSTQLACGRNSDQSSCLALAVTGTQVALTNNSAKHMSRAGPA